jgi:hypothetical protein
MSVVKAAARSSGSASVTRWPRSMAPASEAASRSRNSTSSAAMRGPTSKGKGRTVTCARSEPASMISSATAPAALSGATAAPAWASSAKKSRAVARAGGSGTVRRVTSARKPSVPSEPTSRWASMSAGRS